MQQARESKAGDAARRSRETRVSRQARVGIIANGKELVLPVHAPREIWTRWPDLRSARRRKGVTLPDSASDKTPDPILSGDALRAFVDELRSAEEDGAAASGSDEPEGVLALPEEPRIDPPTRAGLRPTVWIGLGVLSFAVIGLFVVLR